MKRRNKVNNHPSFSLRAHNDAVHSIAFHPEDQNLFCSADKENLFVWDIRTRRPIEKIVYNITDTSKNLFHINWYGNSVVTQDRHGFVTIYDERENFEAVSTFSTRCTTFLRSQFTRNDPTLLWTGGNSQDEIGLWNVETGDNLFSDEMKNISHETGMIMDMQTFVFQNEDYVAFCSEGGHVDILSAQGLHVGGLQVPDPCTAILMNHSGNAMITTTTVNKFYCIQMNIVEEEYNVFKTVEVDCEGMSTSAIRDDCKIFGFVGWDKCVRLYSWKTQKLILKLPQTHTVNHFQFQPNTNRFAIGLENGNIVLYDAF